MSASKTRVQKMLTFPKAMYNLLEKRAEDVGLNTPEYIRYLVVNDIKSADLNIGFINQTLAEARDEYKLGKTTTIKDTGQLKDRYKELAAS